MTCTTESGTCGTCRGACQTKPGWFRPGEVERTAELLGMTPIDLFRTKLSVDWYEADHRMDETTFVLSPAVVDGDPGEEFDGDPRGVCVFYKEGRCEIHEAKPYECAAYVCTDTNEVGTRHFDVATQWRDHQDQIVDLLGREPIEAPYEGGMFGLLGMSW